MSQDRFLIAPLQSGLQNDLVAWQIMDDSWASLNNAYVWRGRLRKRFGSKYMSQTATAVQAPLLSRLRTSYDDAGNVMATSGAGDITAIVPGATGYIGQMFSIGDYTYTIIDITAGPQNMLTDDPAATIYTFNSTNGQVHITTATGHGVPVYFYPTYPVMGLANYKVGAINNQPSFAFDIAYAYTYNNGWQRSGLTTEWHGSDSQFFWTTNFTEATIHDTALFVTNFNATIGAPGATDDPMYYWNGTVWTNFSIGGGFAVSGGIYFLSGGNDFVQTARIIVPFHNRLLLLNTIEHTGAAPGTNNAYPQRCRFSINGSPIANDAWLENDQTRTIGATTYRYGGAGYIDAATKEQIVTAGFIKDRLIVYFERSTWEIAYTGNEIQPFLWQKLNTELGAESTFSPVPFDKVVLAMGNTGVHACNGVNVERIDSKIPNETFQIQNKDDGIKRIAGIRDYYTEMVYWTYTQSGRDTIFPNRVFVFNYNNGNWAFNDDCITTFGYYEQQTDVTWANSHLTWAEYTAAWNSGIAQSQFRQVIGGNQQGFTFIISADITRNEFVMSVTDMAPAVPPPVAIPVEVTANVIDHTLRPGEYFQFRDNGHITGLDGMIFTVKRIINQDNFVFDAPFYTADYIGNGYIARVSRIFAQSKQWNPYQKSGRNCTINRIDFAVKKTTNGQIIVDYSPSTSQLSMIQEGTVTGAMLGSNVLETSPYPLMPFETEQVTLWHPVYFDTDGEFVQITLTLNDTQMKLPAIVYEDFWLEGLVLNTQPTSQRLQ